jgi:hypothetical protein
MALISQMTICNKLYTYFAINAGHLKTKLSFFFQKARSAGGGIPETDIKFPPQ